MMEFSTMRIRTTTEMERRMNFNVSSDHNLDSYMLILLLHCFMLEPLEIYIISLAGDERRKD